MQQFRIEKEHLQCECSQKDEEEVHISSPSPVSPAAVHSSSKCYSLNAGQTVRPASSVRSASLTQKAYVNFPHTLSANSLLRVDAGIPAVGFRCKVVWVALTATVPELGTGVGFGVVVPLDHILAARTWVQWLTAAFIWKDKKGAVSELWHLYFCVLLVCLFMCVLGPSVPSHTSALNTPMWCLFYISKCVWFHSLHPAHCLVWKMDVTWYPIQGKY